MNQENSKTLEKIESDYLRMIKSFFHSRVDISNADTTSGQPQQEFREYLRSRIEYGLHLN